MKKGFFLLLLCLYFCWSCYDELSDIGPSIQPDGDRIGVYADTFNFSAVTLQSDSVYARSSSGQLGEFYDPTYGTLKSDFMCQFYVPPGYRFPDSVINNQIDSVTFQILYQSWVGDSLALMHASIYPLKEQLSPYFYSNADPSMYADLNRLWGEKSYTTYDLSVSDSLHNTSSYYPTLMIHLPTEIGTRFLEESRKSGENAFSNQTNFNNFFPGLYVTTTGGSGSLLTVDYAMLNIHFKYIMTEKDSEGNDSTYITRGQATFDVTKEVIQLNQVINHDLESMLRPNNTTTYLKTPAGVYTVVKLPIRSIRDVVVPKDRHLNSVLFSIKSYPKDLSGFQLKAPTRLLMTSKDSMFYFFEEQKIADNKNYFIASYDSTALTYNFGNIAAFVEDQYTRYPERDSVEVALIPVSVSSDADGNMTSVTNYFQPSAVQLRKDSLYTKISVVTTSF